MAARKSAGNAAAKSGARKTYQLVSADQHINEPPDMWTSRVVKKFKDRVPHIKRLREGDGWIIEGVKDPISFGLNVCAGLKPEECRDWLRWDRVRKGGYVPKERLKDMDVDGVDAAIMFGTPRLSAGVITNPDPELQRAMVRAYNEFMAEFVSYAPDRLFGAIWLPATGVKDAIAELEHFIEMPGMVGPVINCYPNGTTTLGKEDEPLWRLLAEMDIPLSIHVDLRDKSPAKHTERITGGTRNRDAEKRMLEFMWAGVLDRYPNFKIVFSEVDAGWVPFFKEQIDNRYHRQARGSNIALSKAPSKYFDEHYFYTFITDTYAIRNRDSVGVKNMLWSDDFPHMGGDWPFTQRSLSQYFGGVSAEDCRLIQAQNAVRLYRLPGLVA